LLFQTRTLPNLFSSFPPPFLPYVNTNAVLQLPPSDSKPTPASKPAPPQDPASLRRAVLSGLISAASPKPLPITAFSPTFESILSDYLPESNSEGAVELCAGPEIIVPSVESSSMCAAGAEGKKAEATDEWAGIW
jgi:hypothetical protein